MTKWLITGANGNLGRRLVCAILEQNAEDDVCAVVRSDTAAQTLRSLDLPPNRATSLTIQILDYTDSNALAEASRGCDVAVHLVGIIKEGSRSTYVDAHEDSCRALAQACSAVGVGQIVYLSIVGSTPVCANACLASKGAAEEILRASGIKTAIIRVPMVLGEGDYASKALYYRALKPICLTFRASSLEQPIYAGDVVTAVMLAARSGVDASVDLGGPEVLTRRALTKKAAARLGRSTKVVSLPVGLVFFVAWLLELVNDDPPLTRAMLGVLDHDDQVDSDPARSVLGLNDLTDLDAMLDKVLSP